MMRLIGVEFFKLRKRWLPFALLLVLLFMLLFPKLISYASYRSISSSSQNPPVHTITQKLEDGSQTTTVITVPNGGMEGIADSMKEGLVMPGAMDGVFGLLMGALGAIMVIILGASVVGSEYGWGTVRQVLAKGTGRFNYLGSKVITASLSTVAGVIIIIIAGFVMGVITTRLVNGSVIWSFLSAGFAGDMLSSTAVTLLVLGAYLAVAVFLSVLLRSAGTAMSVGIPVIFVDTIMAGIATGVPIAWIREILRLSIGFNAQQLAAAVAGANPEALIRPWWQSSGMLVAYIVVLGAAAFYLLKRQDLTA
jgi:ABC-2 type transport system permease protein